MYVWIWSKIPEEENKTEEENPMKIDKNEGFFFLIWQTKNRQERLKW